MILRIVFYISYAVDMQKESPYGDKSTFNIELNTNIQNSTTLLVEEHVSFCHV